MALQIVTYALIAAMLAGSLAYLLFYLRENTVNPTGKGAEKITTRTLKRFGVVRNCRVLTGIALEEDDQRATLENLLVGPFGILAVHTCGARGDYYGTLDSETWSVTRNTDKTVFPNPLLEQQRAIRILRSLFAKNNVYNVPIEHLVVLTNRSNNTALYISNNGEILMPGKLKAHLAKSKFEKDNNVDVEKIAGMLVQYCK